MKNTTAKKLVFAFVALAFFVGMQVVFADGSATKTHNPYETGLGDTFNMDTTLVIGAVLYGAGVIFTSSSKAILAKLGTRFIK